MKKSLKVFQSWIISSPLAPLWGEGEGGDRHMPSQTFLEEIQFRTTSILSFFPGDAYFWQCWVLKPHPHLYAKRTQERIMWKCRRTAFAFFRSYGICWQTGKCYPSGVGTSKKNMFAIILMWTYTHSGSQWITSGTLAHSLVWQTLNKQLFGIRLGPACLVRIHVQMWTRLYR